MAIKSRFDDVAKLVDTEQGFISREIFVDPDLYKEELDKVFTRAWLFIGHESLIPNPGDFYTTRMGEESVILCRDKRGVVHAFLNSCRHRGMKVCRYESGNTSIFTCPYHSWTYTTDGKLQGVPQYRSLYDGQLDRDAVGVAADRQLDAAFLRIAQGHAPRDAVASCRDQRVEQWLGRDDRRLVVGPPLPRQRRCALRVGPGHGSTFCWLTRPRRSRTADRRR